MKKPDDCYFFDEKTDPSHERDGRTKGNNEYQKVINNIMIYSVATIALPIIFFKDIFQEKIDSGKNIAFFIIQQSYLAILPLTGYICLFFCMYCCIQYINYSGFYLRQLARIINCDEWLQTRESIKLQSDMQFFYNGAWIGWSMGTISILTFLIFYRKFSSDALM